MQRTILPVLRGKHARLTASAQRRPSGLQTLTNALEQSE